MPVQSKRQIFRSKAMQRYTQNNERTVLPRAIAPPVFAFLWILLGVLIAAVCVAWIGRVPLYTSGVGVVLPGNPTQKGSSDAVAIIFVPTSGSMPIRAGQPVQIQIGSGGPQLTSTISTVQSHVYTPQEIYQKYALRVLEPCLGATVNLGHSVSGQDYAASIVNAQIQVESRRLLSLFPVFNALLKDK